MNEKLREDVNALFGQAPPTPRVIELREELLINLEEKYTDLVANGYNEDDAVNAVIAGIGDINELIEEDRMDNNDGYNEMIARKRLAIFTVSAIALYFVAFILLCFGGSLTPDSGFRTAISFAIAGVATCVLVYGYMSTPRYQRSEDTIVEDFKKWRSDTELGVNIRKSVSTVIWLVTVAIYALVSFNFMNWYISWVIFLIGAAIDRIAMLFLDMRGITNGKK